jgi:integrase
MTWENVDLERAAVSFMPEKTARKKKRLEIPLHPRLLAYLKEIGTGSTMAGPLFPTQYKVSARGNHGLSGQFVAIIDQSGIDRKLLRESKGRQRAQYARSFHSLRHSLTSNLANLDVPEEIRRRIVGHESADVHAKYTHTERETLARALEKLPSI